jgi:hypothetical protein
MRPRAVVLPTAGTLAAAETLAQALGGVVADRDSAGVRLAVSLGPPCPAAERRVLLGSDGESADYAVNGEPAVLAAGLARAVATTETPAKKEAK